MSISGRFVKGVGTVIALALATLSPQTSFGADQTFSDAEVLKALENGCALVYAKILSVRAEEDRQVRHSARGEEDWRVNFYYYDANVQRLIIPGDLSPVDVQSPLALYAGASYGDALEVGASYALFVTKDATYFFSYAHRDNFLRIAPEDVAAIEQVEARAREIYAKTQMRVFREAAPKEAVQEAPLPEELKDACARFRNGQGSRFEQARAICASDIGSEVDDLSGFSSSPEFLPPKVRLLRAQVLQLLGQATIKDGYEYKWLCGKDAEGHAEVLTIQFDPQERVHILRCDADPLNHWMKEDEVPTVPPPTAPAPAPNPAPRPVQP